MTITTGSPASSAAPASSAHALALEAETHARAARKLHSHAGVASILNTKPGKMTLLQMQQAVQRKQVEEKKREEQVAIMAKRAVMGGGSSKSNEEEKATATKATATSASPDDGIGTEAAMHPPLNLSHPLDYSVHPDTDALFGGEGLQMQELVFGRALALYSAHERSLEINPTKHRIGAQLMTEAQRDRIEEEREAQKAAAQASKRAAQRAQSQNILSSARVISMVGERSLRAPTFIVDESEPWPSRARLLAKLKGALNKFVVRRRVDERLANVAAHQANKLKNKLARIGEGEDGEEADKKQSHPLLPVEGERDEDWVLRDFPLCTNNVQSVGHLRGHDNVTRIAVALEPINKPNQLVTFDEIIPFDAGLMGYPTVSAPVVPSFVGSDWLAGMRTGAWEESLLRAPRGESEVEEATAAAAKTVGAAGVAVAAPLTIHAQLPSTAGPAPLLTSPVHASVSLLDVDSQNSRPIKLAPPAAAAAPATAGSNAAPVASPTAAVSAAAPTRSAHTKTSDLHLPAHFLSSHPIAQQHSVASSPALSAPMDVPVNTELSPNYSFRAANMRDNPDTGFFYTKEGAGCSSLRTLQGMTTLSDLWRPRREPALAGMAALVDSFSLPLGSSSSSVAGGGLRHLRRQPREDRIDPRDREVPGDETSVKLRYKPLLPNMHLAESMYDQAAANVAVAAEKAAQTAAALAGSSASHASSAPAAAPASAARLDIGLGLSLLATAIQFPPALAAAAARAQAQASSAAVAASATAAASSAVAASPRSSRGRRDDSAAGEDGALSPRSRRDGAASPSERSRSKKSAAAAAATAAPVAQLPPRMRGAHGSALPPAGSGVPLGEGGLDLLLPASSVVAQQWQPSAAVLAHATSAPGASSASSLLAASRPPAQALALASFQSSSSPSAAAVPAASSSAGMNPSALSWGPGAQSASAALEQRLAWSQVQPTNALALSAHSMHPMTQHPQQHMTLLTQK